MTAMNQDDTAATPMHTAPMKANSAGISMSWRVDAPARSGSPTTVALHFDGVTDPGGAVVRLRTDDGLWIGEPSTTVELPPGEATSRLIALWHNSPGLRYLHVFTTQNDVTSVMSVPVSIGDSKTTSLSPGAVYKASDGDRIIAMPVN